MLSALDQMLRDWLARHGRPPQLVEYTPYLLSIGSMLAWYVRGLLRDCVREFRYRMRKRNLRLIQGRPAAVLPSLKIRP